MPGDLRLDPAASGTQASLKAAVPIDAGLRDVSQAATPALPSAASSNSAADLPNPRLHTDLALNRLVLEFFDAQGTLTNSIPSQKQLDAYRLAAFAGKTHQPVDAK